MLCFLVRRICIIVCNFRKCAKEPVPVAHGNVPRNPSPWHTLFGSVKAFAEDLARVGEDNERLRVNVIH